MKTLPFFGSTDTARRTPPPYRGAAVRGRQSGSSPSCPSLSVKAANVCGQRTIGRGHNVRRCPLLAVAAILRKLTDKRLVVLSVDPASPCLRHADLNPTTTPRLAGVVDRGRFQPASRSLFAAPSGGFCPSLQYVEFRERLPPDLNFCAVGLPRPMQRPRPCPARGSTPTTGSPVLAVVPFSGGQGGHLSRQSQPHP
jgi:hypothetical protein